MRLFCEERNHTPARQRRGEAAEAGTWRPRPRGRREESTHTSISNIRLVNISSRQTN